MIRIYILSLVFVMMGANVCAQKISFANTTITTGSTLWHKPVTATFKFTNKERTPLIINEVDAGCGCLQPEWTKGEINKGEEGEISVTYDAKLLGRFDRIIEVHTNAAEKPIRLRMKGLVTTGDHVSITDIYPFRIGDICLNTNNVEFPDANAGDSVRFSLEILNDGQEVYTPQLMHLPPYITAEAKPVMLARGRRGTIELILHGDKLVNMGLNQTSIYLSRFSGDKVGSDNEIAVSAVLLPEFSQSDNTTIKPDFSVSATELDMGKLGNKSKLTGKIKITNNGKGVLKLNAIQVFNQALSVSLPRRELVSGESITMKVVLHAKYLHVSKNQPRVLIITNDPAHPKATINIKYE
ncbi:MAG: DUF1573 domain-containing protein [Bacteroides sp.]|nr:DUF1573 domain-containing protein [Roseburia sp.]MCM1346646.1 DUF1573 domain-containing protein [Bacteroides sp.]MCM1419924.1 DUF1573 domain-containing protein [Bacteroides sp.]